MGNQNVTPIKRLIREKKSSLTNAEILLHPQFVKMINAENRQIFRSWMLPGKKLVVQDGGEGVAYTDNKKLYINVSHPAFDDVSRETAIAYVYGLAFHEIGHVLFTSFTGMKSYFEALGNGYFYPATPVVPEAYDSNLSAISECLKDKTYARNLSAILKELTNIVEDARIEHLLYAFCDNCSKHKKGLNAFNQQLLGKAKATDIMSYKNEAAILNQLILIYAKFGVILCDESTKYYKLLSECREYVEAAKHSEKSAEFYNNINIVFTICWPVYEEYLKKAQEESMGAGDGEDISEKIADELSEELIGGSASHKEDEELAESEGSDSANTSEKIASAPPQEDIREEGANDINVDALISRIAKEEADKKWEQENTLELEKLSNNLKYGKLHKAGSVIIERPVVIDEMHELYNSPSVQKFVKIGRDAARKVKKSLPKEKEATILKNRVVGSQFDASAVCRNDLRYFSKKSKPENGPSLSLGLLVDESGSMFSHDRIVSAKSAAVALYTFAEELELPVSVYGHTADVKSSGDVLLINYSDFSKNDSNDKYRLMNISSRRENRDAVPLQYLSERLLSTECDRKLLIVISDGSPVAHNYYGSKAERDLQQVVMKYAKKGITIIAAAIGEDKENIKRIYSPERFMDISDLNRLPSEMLKIVKRNLKWS